MCCTGKRKPPSLWGRKKPASSSCKVFCGIFPNSAITELTVASLAQTANWRLEKVETLSPRSMRIPNTSAKPPLLLLRAQAHEKIASAKAEKPTAAARTISISTTAFR